MNLSQLILAAVAALSGMHSQIASLTQENADLKAKLATDDESLAEAQKAAADAQAQLEAQAQATAQLQEALTAATPADGAPAGDSQAQPQTAPAGDSQANAAPADSTAPDATNGTDGTNAPAGTAPQS